MLKWLGRFLIFWPFGVIFGPLPTSTSTPPASRTYSAAPQYVPTTKDEDIATLAIAKEQLSKINPGDIEMGLHVLKSSAMMWRKFKDWQKLGPQTAKEEMNDEIPEL